VEIYEKVSSGERESIYTYINVCIYINMYRHKSFKYVCLHTHAHHNRKGMLAKRTSKSIEFCPRMEKSHSKRHELIFRRDF